MKIVSTNALKIPPSTPDSAIADQAAGQFASGERFPVISLIASMLAVDSANTTAITMLIATTAVIGNSGDPKWNGAVMPIQSADRRRR